MDFWSFDQPVGMGWMGIPEGYGDVRPPMWKFGVLYGKYGPSGRSGLVGFFAAERIER